MEKRVRNVQIGRLDGRIKEERFEGLWLKNEDWYVIWIVDDVDMYYFVNF